MTQPEKKSESICDIAKDITGNDRMKKYGHPARNFAQIAKFWNVYLENKAENQKIDNEKAENPKKLNFKLDAMDVAEMMCLFKVAREQAGHQLDNLVDRIGYTRNKAQIMGYE